MIFTQGRSERVMTLLQMQYFVAVCQTGSTLQAAQTLNIAQSAVSSAVKNLEVEFGVSLFQRTSKGMIPTEAGRYLLERYSQILQDIRDVEREMARFASIRRPIRLGIPVLLNQMYWLELYFKLKQAFPEIEFQVVNRTVSVLFDMLKRNELDGVICLRTDQDFHENCVILREENCRYVSMSTSHPLAAEKMVSYQQLTTYPILRYAGDNLKFKLLCEIYQKFGVEPQYQQFDQFSTLIQFLRKNAGIAYLHKDVTRHYPDLTSIPIREAAGKQYLTYLVWSKNGLLARAPKRLFQIFKDYFIQLDQLPPQQDRYLTSQGTVDQ